MRSRQTQSRIRQLLIVSGILAIGWLAYVTLRVPSQSNLEKIEAEVKERLPIGSTRSEVKAWMNSHNLECIGILAGPPVDGAMAPVIAKCVRIPDDSATEKAFIWVEFYEDANGRLTELKIYRRVHSVRYR